VSESVFALHPDPEELKRLALRLARMYRSGVYSDPPDEESDAFLAVYSVDGTTYWVQRAASGQLVIFLPKDY